MSNLITVTIAPNASFYQSGRTYEPGETVEVRPSIAATNRRAGVFVNDPDSIEQPLLPGPVPEGPPSLRSRLEALEAREPVSTSGFVTEDALGAAIDAAIAAAPAKTVVTRWRGRFFPTGTISPEDRENITNPAVLANTNEYTVTLDKPVPEDAVVNVHVASSAARHAQWERIDASTYLVETYTAAGGQTTTGFRLDIVHVATAAAA